MRSHPTAEPDALWARRHACPSCGGSEFRYSWECKPVFEALTIDRVVERWLCLQCGHDDHRSSFVLLTRTSELSVLWDDG